MANWIWYGNALLGQFGNTAARRVDLSAAGDTLKCMLTNATEVPDQDVDDFIDDASANEVTGTGYTAGGLALTSKGISYDATTNEFRFVFADLVWGPGATISGIKNAHLYKDTGVPATSPLIAYTIFATAQAVSNGTFTIDVDATTCLKVTAAAT